MKRRGFLAGVPPPHWPLRRSAEPRRHCCSCRNRRLASLDPVWTSAMTTRNIGFQIYDVLFGRDEWMNPKPQMLAGYVVEDDGKRWVMTLRENQWFHDGEKVLARDCVASLKRWMVRDPAGATLKSRLDAIEAPDDRTIVLRLNRKLPSLPKALSKFQTAAVMVPERLANTDPFKQMPEAIGSGPFRFLKDEYVIGSHAALVPFEKLCAARRKAEFHLRRSQGADRPHGVEDDPGRLHGGERSGDRRDRLAGNAVARSVAGAARRAQREGRPSGRVWFHQPVAAQSRDRADQQRETAAGDSRGDQPA